MAVGHLASKHKEVLFEYKLWIIFSLIAFVIGMMAIHFNRISKVNFDNNEYGDLFLMLLGSLLVSYALSCVVYHFHPFVKIFTFFGKHAIFILGFDYFSIMIANKLLFAIGFQNWLSLFCLKIIILTVGIYLWYWLLSFIHNEKIKEMLRY